jgi:hydroxypyruvate reductase
MNILPERINSYSLRESSRGDDIRKILAAGINGVDATKAIKGYISCTGNLLKVNNVEYDLSIFNRIYVLGAGKASIPMAAAISEILSAKITSGLVITKSGNYDSNVYEIKPQIKIIEANHPVPDQSNIAASNQVVGFTRKISSNDLVICLISGGGSSLLTFPRKNISLEDMQNVTSGLLNCGASIDEINCIRKHIDLFKGGGLLNFLSHAMVITLILSDVIGDDPSVIASGPTAADPTTYSDVLFVLNKYQIYDQIPASIKSIITAGKEGRVNETIKPDNQIFNKVLNVIIGNNSNALLCAHKAARDCGFDTNMLPYSLQGEASRMGFILSQEAKSILSMSPPKNKPICRITGGETTVTVKQAGMGGRNQELALGAVKNLAGKNEIMLICLATDGIDGPTDAAGAVVTNETYSRGMTMGLDPDLYISRNDSYLYFQTLGDLLKTGSTMTNANDLALLFIF